MPYTWTIDDVEELRIPADKGLAGHVVQTGETINIKDAYSDGRFNHLYQPENGESFNSIVLRAYAFLQNVVNNHENKNILVITHNGVITALKYLYEKKSSTESIKQQQFLVPYEVEVNEVILNEMGSFINA